MTRVQTAILVLLGAIGGAVALWQGGAALKAQAEYDRALAIRDRFAAKVAQIEYLRELPPVRGFGAKPSDDVIVLVNRTLAAAGLNASLLRSVNPEGERAVADDRDRRRSSTVRISLEPLTVQELGVFLASWRSSQQVWSVGRIELNAQPQSAQASGRQSGTYRVNVTVTATYADDTSTPPSTALSERIP